MSRIRTVLVTLTLLLSSVGIRGDVTRFHEVLPHVVEGCSGICLETTVTLVNPEAEAVEVTLLSSAFDVGTPFLLSPLQTREIRFDDTGELKVGAIQVIADTTLSVSATLRSKSGPEATGSLSVATVLASPLTSKALLPVVLHSPIAENTGLALYYNYIATVELDFTLVDLEGQEVASVRGRTPVDPVTQSSSAERASFFLSELFPNLPETFTAGSLIVEQAVPAEVADSFAVVALYTQGPDFRTAEVAAVDDTRTFVVMLPNDQGVAEIAAELADLYGFTVGLVVTDFFEMRGTKEVARAVARDKRVLVVLAPEPISLSP